MSFGFPDLRLESPLIGFTHLESPNGLLRQLALSCLIEQCNVARTIKLYEEGENMRGSRFVLLSLIVVALLGTVASGVSAAGAVCQCFDSDFAGRVIGGFDGSSANLRLEAAMGLPEFSLAAWADIDLLPTPSSTFGGELRLTRDWLSIGLVAQQGEFPVDLRLQGQANPSPWMLYDGTPTLIGGITAVAETELLKSISRSEITLSPFLTGVIPAGDTTVSPFVGIDFSLDSETQVLTISGSRLASTVNAGCVLIANTVHFAGLFDAFSSLVVSVNVPEWRLTLSGSLLPTPAGGFSYRVSIGYEWGDTYLLPNQPEKPETVCTDGVCF